MSQSEGSSPDGSEGAGPPDSSGGSLVSVFPAPQADISHSSMMSARPRAKSFFQLFIFSSSSLDDFLCINPPRMRGRTGGESISVIILTLKFSNFRNFYPLM